MRKKGFTLIELLAVLVLIALVSLFTVTTVSREYKKGKKKLYNEQLITIKMSAQMWGSEHKSILKQYNTCVAVKISSLINDGYIEKNIINSKTGNVFTDDDVIILITPNQNNYKYEVIDVQDNTCEDIL